MNNDHDLLVDQKVASQQFSEEQQTVIEAMDRWIEAVTTADPDSVAKLYAKDAVFWGTVSPFMRTTFEGIKNYFVHFMRLKNLNAFYYKPMVRVYGDIAIISGYYTFYYEQNDTMMSIPARYTFAYRKNQDGEWRIVDHHSSAVPQND